jgi:FMN phosphatase YigB (HAD superfamily)
MNPSNISHIFFDVDDTLYDKLFVSDPSIGSVQDSHDFFKYKAHALLSQGFDPLSVHNLLVCDYDDLVDNNFLAAAVKIIPADLKREFDALTKEHGANGRVFDNYWGLMDKGVTNYLHNMLQHVAFDRILTRDNELVETINHLKAEGYVLGIMTTEVYKTVEDTLKILGLDIDDFAFKNPQSHPELKSKNGNEYYPVLSRDNIVHSKPHPEGFEKISAVSGEPFYRIVYVGDSVGKDIKPALRLGMNAIHINRKEQGMHTKILSIDGSDKEYIQVRSVHALRDIFDNKNMKYKNS